MTAPAGLSRRRRRGGAFSPQVLFANGEPGVWYDPSDLTTLYQDSVGTTPVTALGQPVGLMLDKSRGALNAIGPELSNPASWVANPLGTATTTITGSSVQLLGTDATNRARVTVASLVSASSYLLTFNATVTSGELRVGTAPDGTSAVLSVTTTGVRSVFIQGRSTMVFATGNVGGNVTISNISVREVPGVHAIQSTSSARPTVQARSNTVTGSELLSTFTTLSSPVISANSRIAPDGTPTADRFEVSSGNTGFTIRTVGQAASPSATPFAFSFYFYPDTGASGSISMGQGSRRTCLVNLATLAVTNANVGGATSLLGRIVNVGGGWYRYEAAATADGGAGGEVQIVLESATAGSAVWLWGAQNEVGASAPTAYQRVTTATDYADIGLPRYLQFDGSDDSMVTAANLNLTSTDKVSVFAGLEKRADTVSVPLEFGPPINSNNQAFALFAPSNTGSLNARFNSKGTVLQFATAPNVLVSQKNVFAGQADISGDLVSLRQNSILVDQSTGDQGNGNYTSNLLYLGARNGNSLPLNGLIYQLIVRGAATDATTVQQAERFVGQKTGVVIP